MFILIILIIFIEFINGQLIYVNPTVLIKDIGENALFTCGIENETSFGVVKRELQWIDTRLKEILSTYQRVYTMKNIELNTNTLSLFFEDIRATDSGKYTCMYWNGNDKIEKSVQLKISRKIRFNDVELIQNIVLHKSNLVKCSVEGDKSPIVSWRINNTLIDKNDNDYVIDLQGLIVKNTQKYHNGIYQCRAVLSDLSNYDYKNIKVNVIWPPFFKIKLRKEILVPEYQKKSIKCEAEGGNPPPTYKFLRNGVPITEMYQIMTSDTLNGLLKIEHARLELTDTYECEASNLAGVAIQTIPITIGMIPRPRRIVNATDYIGSTIHITCQVRSNPEPIMFIEKWPLHDSVKWLEDDRYPAKEATYYDTIMEYMHNKNIEDYKNPILKNQNTLLVDNRISVKVFNYSLTLTINNIQITDQANYSCIAVNAAGLMRANVSLNVLHEPIFNLNASTKKIYIWSGYTRNLSCIFSANPEGKVEWYRYGVKLYHDDIYLPTRHRFFQNHWYLQIYAKHRHDVIGRNDVFGTYTCRAFNKIGTKEIQMKVIKGLIPKTPIGVLIKHITPTSAVVEFRNINETLDRPKNLHYHIRYANKIVQVENTHKNTHGVVLNKLNPNSDYKLQIYAVNEVGNGPTLISTFRTKNFQIPSNPKITKLITFSFINEVTLFLKTPETGGKKIVLYEIIFRKLMDNFNMYSFNISIESNIKSLDSKTFSDWVLLRFEEDVSMSSRFIVVTGLDDNSLYEVVVYAKNSIGYSEPTCCLVGTNIEAFIYTLNSCIYQEKTYTLKNNVFYSTYQLNNSIQASISIHVSLFFFFIFV
ncbi:hypothetical protein A3Q56_03853 [Intoshia linei]|uniref:Uncharacterized protein n=1 Tax=Intoshia linei TaxID=1819745 RepID=A0A177B2P9_9BILA|nr:hypothetical protein A3Q56_03853 [Intoshia linei]